MFILGIERDHEKPMTLEDMEHEIKYRSRIGAVRDPMKEFTDETVTKVLSAIGLDFKTTNPQDNARTNLDTSE